MSNGKLEAYIDGACEPKNPGGTVSYGVLVRRFRNLSSDQWRYNYPYEVIWQDCGIVDSGPKMSNNVGEYFALIKLLEWYLTTGKLSGIGILDYEPLIICSDSQLVVNQMNGSFRVIKGLYVPYYNRASTVVKQHGLNDKLNFRWIPREQNLADELSVRALTEIGIIRRKR